MFKRVVIGVVALALHFHAYSQESGVSIGLFAGPSSYSFEESDSWKFSQNISYSYGGFLKINIPVTNSTLSFRTGYYINNKKYDRDFADTNSYRPDIIHTEYKYGNIPVLIELKFNTQKRINPFLCIGVNFRHIVSEEQEVVLNNGEQDNSFFNRSSFLENPKDFTVRFGCEIGVLKRTLVRFEGYFCQQVNEGSPSNRDQFGTFTFGLRIGIVYDFVFNKSIPSTKPFL